MAIEEKMPHEEILELIKNGYIRKGKFLSTMFRRDHPNKLQQLYYYGRISIKRILKITGCDGTSKAIYSKDESKRPQDLTLYLKIKKYREEGKMTFEQIGKKLGKHTQSVNRTYNKFRSEF